ncbi:chitinase [Aspergillus sclerotialis]|uniref:chitinase n=1 Tax=Aspergillus sclerotialis TaxID=2070753 RepID=A0A3A2ZWD8_9EURO|nr:chitinase [Aspergillus sclerotialis]
MVSFSFKGVLYWTVGFSAVQSVRSFLDTDSSNNMAVYWGQNSGNSEQKPLGFYCDNPHIDVFQLAFMTRVRGQGEVPEIDFANQGNACDIFPGTGLLNCPQIGADIKACQAKGKTILLSIGGATYTEGGFTSAEEATAAAQKVWDVFGPVKPGSNAPRPFGDAVIDGFDFDFESHVSNMVPFANELRKLMDSSAPPQAPNPSASSPASASAFPSAKSSSPVIPPSSKWYTSPPPPAAPVSQGQPSVSSSPSSTSSISTPSQNGQNGKRKYYLTAAPQCVFPDAADHEMLNGAVSFDAIFVQFYNNFCGLNSFVQGTNTQRAFNFDLWDGWAKSASKNKNVKVLIGMPGSPSAAGSGFVPAHVMQEVLEWSKSFSSFGGLMVWDATQAYEVGGLLPSLKSFL